MSADPRMGRALEDWLGLYAFNQALGRAWGRGPAPAGGFSGTDGRRAADGPSDYGLRSAEVPLPAQIFRALLTGARTLHELEVKYVLGGGLAANYHGQERATKDVDFFVLEDQGRLDPLLTALKRVDMRPHRSERPSFLPPAALFWWVPLQFGLPDAAPVDVDLLVAAHEFMAMLHATGRETDVGGVRIRVLGAEGLILLKLQAFRDKDRWDVKEILKSNPELDRALLGSWARKFKLQTRLARMIRENREQGGRRFG